MQRKARYTNLMVPEEVQLGDKILLDSSALGEFGLFLSLDHQGHHPEPHTVVKIQGK